MPGLALESGGPFIEAVDTGAGCMARSSPQSGEPPCVSGFAGRANADGLLVPGTLRPRDCVPSDFERGSEAVERVAGVQYTREHAL